MVTILTYHEKDDLNWKLCKEKLPKNDAIHACY